MSILSGNEITGEELEREFKKRMRAGPMLLVFGVIFLILGLTIPYGFTMFIVGIIWTISGLFITIVFNANPQMIRNKATKGLIKKKQRQARRSGIPYKSPQTSTTPGSSIAFQSSPPSTGTTPGSSTAFQSSPPPSGQVTIRVCPKCGERNTSSYCANCGLKLV